MAATQRRTLALTQSLHLKQEPLTLRSLTHSAPQQQNAAPATIIKSETMQSIDLEGGLVKHAAPSSNGFHPDVPAAPTIAPNTFLGIKSAKLQHFLEENTSPESKRSVDSLLSQMQMLSAQEKMLLYLKLPGAKNGLTQPQADPLRQPINPLGTRHEIQQTITWIKTHLTEDPDVSLPKQDVYDEYMNYCEANNMKHLSTADFGKVMKQVFPRVRPRRLGTRGNSRYCYAGLCKRMRLDRPMLPDLACDAGSPILDKDGDSNLEAAASYLIREWAQKLLGEQFGNLRELATHLIEKMCVDGRSVAAYALLDATRDEGEASSALLEAKERDAHFERKVTSVEKELGTAKRKSSLDEKAERPASGCKRQRLKNGRASVESPVRCRSEPKKRPSPSASSSSVSPAPTPTSKMPIPRLSGSSSRSTTPKLILISPSKQQQQAQQPPQPQLQPQSQHQQNKKYKRIQPKPEPPMDNGEEANFLTELTETGELPQELLSISTLEQSVFDDILNEGNSQEQEDDELMTYFHHDSPATVTNPEPPAQIVSEEPAKISQLRRLLERNERVKESTKRRVSFENVQLDTVPASPNTRRRVFNFLPISPDDPQPALQAPPPSPASTITSASPFVSPGNTPVPRSRNNSGQQFIYPLTRMRHSSAGPKQRGRNFSGPGFELPMLAPPDGRQRHVSAGGQALLPDLCQEVSNFLSAESALPSLSHQFRSQSVPLSQMLCGVASASSVAPTPVPSEFNDFDTSDVFSSISEQLLLEDDLGGGRVAGSHTGFNSRSYPNTPVPDLGGPTLLPSLLAEPHTSRSYPSTPVVGAPDPVISQLTLNAINQPGQFSARRNLSELIDPSNSLSADEHVFNAINAEFAPPAEQDAFHDFDQSELTQLVKEVEGNVLLHDESLS